MCRGLIQVGVNVARSRKKKSSESVRAAGRPGPADLADPTFCTPIWQRDSFCVSFYYLDFPSRRKTIDLPRSCWLSPLLSNFRQKFLLLLISFTHVRVGVVTSSSSSDFSPFQPIPRVVMAPKRHGLTSSPVIH